MRKRILFKDEEISREIERRIEEKRLKEGDRLPSERQMAEDFGVQRDTVRCALEILLKKGVLIKKPRLGYFIAPKRIEIDVNNLHAIKKEVEIVREKNRAILLNYEKISIGRKLSEMTGLPEDTLCYEIMRIRYDYETVISLEKSYIVADHAPGLTQDEIEHRSVASVLKQKYGITLISAQQSITQIQADDMESELLRIRKGEPLVRYSGLLYDRKGRLIEFFDIAVRPESIEFRLRDFA